jgi:hypothetical protein
MLTPPFQCFRWEDLWVFIPLLVLALIAIGDSHNFSVDYGGGLAVCLDFRPRNSWLALNIGYCMLVRRNACLVIVMPISSSIATAT